MATRPKNVVIIGGSLAGLMSGIVLKKLGHNVRIFERSTSAMLQSSGAGIVFGPDAQEYFSKHVKANRELSVSTYARQTLDSHGEVVDRDEREQKMASWDLLYYVLRAAFDGLQSQYCDVPATSHGDGLAEYCYGRKVSDLRNLNELVEVVFEDFKGQKQSEQADLVIAADGPSSTTRSLFFPDLKRRYAGYVAWRGTVPEEEAGELVKETFVDKFTFFHGRGTQILAYLIPSANGELRPGKRLINYVWYCNYAADSPDFKELMTDTDGHLHHITLPVGKMSPQVWNIQKAHAEKTLPASFAKLVTSTREPFVQAITDVISPTASLMDGKVLLVGDAVAGFRPHTAASTSQAAFDALLLNEMMSGEMTRENLEKEMMAYAKHGSESGVKMGDRSQFGESENWKQNFKTIW